MTSTAPGSPGLRADARRNLDRILDAASRVFAERGQSATLADVARAAGVGVGTVYRRFPDKDALLEALFVGKVDALARLAEEYAGRAEVAGAFHDFLLRLMELRATDRVLDLILLGTDRGERFARELGRRFLPHVERLMDRAADAGEIRAGMSAPEVCVLAHLVGTAADITERTAPGTWRRYAQLLVDGTRPSAATGPLSAPPAAFPWIAGAPGGHR